MVDCNKGYDIVREHHDYHSSDLQYTMIDYKCLSADSSGREMKVRYLLKVKELR